MQSWSGNISKMRVSASRMDTNTASNTTEAIPHSKAFNPVYHLPIGKQLVPMNDLIGQHIKVTFAGAIHCVNCQKKTNKSFSQGHCFPCMRKLARCDTCIMKPELCHHAAGTCREPEWGEANCLQDHFVYLANTGQVKVGITRFVDGDVSSRWFDQGATQAVAIFRVKERLLSGLVEIEVAKHVADKTNWRTMLKGQPEQLNLVDLQNKVYELVAEHVQALQTKYGMQSVQRTSTQPIEISYPVLRYPEKVKSINLDKEFHFEGELLGIKGQYLLLDNDRVINVRKYTGYDLKIEV